MSKKARERKKFMRKMMSQWKMLFTQKDLNVCFEHLIAFGVCGTSEDENCNIRAMTESEIEDALTRKPVVNKELSYDILSHKFKIVK